MTTSLDGNMRRLIADEVERQLEGRERSDTMTADEVAEFLGVNRKTVYEYANRGEIPHRRVGKRLLFSRGALVAWLAGGNPAGAQEGR